MYKFLNNSEKKLEPTNEQYSCNNSRITYNSTAIESNNSRLLQALVHGKNSYDKKILSGFGN